MVDKAQALAELAKPRAAGAKRATLALLLSLVALGVSAYGAYRQFYAPRNEAAPEVAMGLGRVNERLDAGDESRAMLMREVTSLREELNMLAGKLEAARAAPLLAEGTGTAAPANTVALDALKEMQDKVAELSRASSDGQGKLADDLLAKSNALAVFSYLEAIKRKIQMGTGFAADVKKLERFFIAGSQGAAPLNALNQAALQEGVSDADLLEEFSPLVTEMMAREKLGKADGVLDKVAIQLQKLVSVRSRDGKAEEGSVVAAAAAALRDAIRSQAWEEAGKLAAELKAYPVKDFEAWHQRLQRRSALEQAVTALQDIAMSEFLPKPAAEAPASPAQPAAPEPAMETKGAP